MPRRLVRFLPWLFLALGAGLLVEGNLVLDSLGDSGLLAALPRSMVSLALAVVIVFCWFTAWGVWRKGNWSLLTGGVACGLLLFGWPWLTPVGAFLMLLLVWIPWQKRRVARGYWDPSRKSPLGAAVSVLALLAAMESSRLFTSAAGRLGMPSSTDFLSLPGLYIAILPVGIWMLQIVVHEGGHALAAWMTGFRVTAFRVGWAGGSVTAFPTSEDGIWRKAILISAAGPAASLGFALAFHAMFFLLPGTSLAVVWPLTALAALVGYWAAFSALLPCAYSDGKMLLHLLGRTARGRELVALKLNQGLVEPAVSAAMKSDPKAVLQLHRDAISRLIQAGATRSFDLATAHLHLGATAAGNGSPDEAQRAFQSALEITVQCGGHPTVEAECRVGLFRSYLKQCRERDAAAAYRDALTALEQERQWVKDRVSVEAEIAYLHVSAGEFAAGAAAIAAVLPKLGTDHHRIQRGQLLNSLVRCELQLGHTGSGLAAAQQAAAHWRMPVWDQEQPVGARSEIGNLGWELWEAGQKAEALALLRESIERLQAMSRVADYSLLLRCRLALILSHSGEHEEAAALPDTTGMGGNWSRALLGTRGAIHQAAGLLEQAVAEHREVLRLTQAGGADELSIAAAQGRLGDALLEAGRLDEAEAAARQAYAQLASAEHPDAASACLTLGVTAWHRQDVYLEWLRESLERLERSRLILHGSKARFLESAARTLAKSGLGDEAERFRAAATAHWKALGLAREFAASA